jgi:hypothetical protein
MFVSSTSNIQIPQPSQQPQAHIPQPPSTSHYFCFFLQPLKPHYATKTHANKQRRLHPTRTTQAVTYPQPRKRRPPAWRRRVRYPTRTPGPASVQRTVRLSSSRPVSCPQARGPDPAAACTLRQGHGHSSRIMTKATKKHDEIVGVHSCEFQCMFLLSVF